MKYKIEEVPIDMLEEAAWNVNVMSDLKFNKLTEEIQQMGFLDPIQVVWIEERKKYRVLGGNHRYNSMLILGYEKIPAIILDDPKFLDEDLQKFLSLRLNMIKGKMTKEKFSALYEDLTRRYNEDFIKDAMALVNKDEWRKIQKELLGNIEDFVREHDFIDFDGSMKELRTVDDITKLLEDVFKKKNQGDSFQRVLALGAGGGKVVYFVIDDESWGLLTQLEEKVKKDAIKMNNLLANVIE